MGTIGPEWVGSQCVSYAAFDSNQASNAEQRNLYKVTLKGGGNAANLVVTEIPVICTPIFRPAVPQSVLESFGKNVKFIDVPAGQEVKVDILIGLDIYWKFMTPERVCLPEGLVAQR